MKYKINDAVVLLSGGQDSVTCLYHALDTYKKVYALTINYAQRHEREIDAARMIAADAGVLHEIIVVGGILDGTSPLTDKRIRVDEYKNYEDLPGGLEATYVPMRNALFLTIAANRAYVNECMRIVIGVSQEDYGGYPDCRYSFIDNAERMIQEATGRKMHIDPPLIFKNKMKTVQFAKELGEKCWNALAYSHTCYKGEFPPCGKCHACILRERGFRLAGLEDPLIERAKNIDQIGMKI